MDDEELPPPSKLGFMPPPPIYPFIPRQVPDTSPFASSDAYFRGRYFARIGVIIAAVVTIIELFVLMVSAMIYISSPDFFMTTGLALVTIVDQLLMIAASIGVSLSSMGIRKYQTAKVPMAVDSWMKLGLTVNICLMLFLQAVVIFILFQYVFASLGVGMG